MTLAGNNGYIFFLGGHDLEMSAILELLEEFAPGSFFDKKLRWGAKASDYREEIEACIAQGNISVLIELKDDLCFDSAVIIDHHGDLSGSLESSIRQVFKLLGLKALRWTRRFELIDANDRGHVHAMLDIGATASEVKNIREADRKAQGITIEEEAEGERAVSQAQTFISGALTVVNLSHGKASTVTDRMEKALGGAGYVNLLVISPDEMNFYGSGDIVIALVQEFPGGWYGGELPRKGFWGHGEPLLDILPFLVKRLETSVNGVEL